jgi:endoglucanase
MRNLVRALCDARGISGDESEVRAVLRQELAGCCTLTTDPLGNLIAEKRGLPTAKKMVFFAHMDEVGLLVTRITEEGLLRFSPIGIDPAVLHGRRVLIGRNAVSGVIGAKALHHLSGDERDKTPAADALFLDIGATNREEAAAVVSPGDAVTFDDPYLELGDGYVAARALDDRMGCALLVSLLRSDCPYAITGVFTCGEESSLFGATAAANTTAPEIAVVLETTTAGDVDGAGPDKVVCALGKGPVVSFADRGTLYDRELFAAAFEEARVNRIPVQTKEGVFGGNEGRVVGRAGRGAKVCAVSIPCRYLHSASVVAKWSDFEDAERLLPLLVRRFAAL